MSMEFNKLLAAFLVAGIIAMLAGFVSHQAFHHEALKENAYPITVADAPADAGGIAVPTVADPIDDLLASADVAQGAKLSKMCAACHTFEKGGPNRVGPNLNGIIGAKRAHMDDFSYSEALKAKGGTWTVEELNQFLWNPKKAVPGTKMAFAGLKKPEDRAAMIKWLEAQ